MAVGADNPEGARTGTGRRRKPPGVSAAFRTLHAVHTVRENRVLHIAATEPARRSNQPCARDLILIGDPQIAGIDPRTVVVVSQDAGIAETSLRVDTLLNDDRLEIIREVEIDAARRVIHVSHFKRLLGTVRDLARKRID